MSSTRERDLRQSARQVSSINASSTAPMPARMYTEGLPAKEEKSSKAKKKKKSAPPSAAAPSEPSSTESEAVMQLDDEAWQGLLDAEACETVTAQMMATLHPYHHKPLLMYQQNLLRLQPAQRAEVLLQNADARERLYAGLGSNALAHPLVANDIEGVGVAHLAAGDPAAAADSFRDAAARFAAFYGPASADTLRCAKAAGLTSLDEYAAMGPQLEVLAHH